MSHKKTGTVSGPVESPTNGDWTSTPMEELIKELEVAAGLKQLQMRESGLLQEAANRLKTYNDLIQKVFHDVPYVWF